MQKLSLISLSILLSVILVGCGSTSDLNDSSTENQFKSDENIQDKSDTDKLTEQEVQSKFNAEVNYKIFLISNADRDKFLREINSARATIQNCGNEGIFPAVSSLKWSTQLYNASYEHNYDMLYSQTFSHDGSATQYDITGVLIKQASTPYTRVVQTGYFKDAYYYGIEENIAEG